MGLTKRLFLIGNRGSLGGGSESANVVRTTSVPKSHIQVSMVCYSPMVRRYLSHSWAPRSAILAHDMRVFVHYIGAQKLH